MFKRLGIFRPLGVALVLAIGFGFVFGFVVGWGNTIWEGMRRQNQERFSEELEIFADGTPLIVRQTDSNGGQKLEVLYPGWQRRDGGRSE